MNWPRHRQGDAKGLDRRGANADSRISRSIMTALPSPVWLALAAAALFGARTPLIKLLIG